VKEHRDDAQHRQSDTQIEQRQQLVHPILIPIEKPAGYWHAATPVRQVEDGEVG
jgi:hypothetical protein